MLQKNFQEGSTFEEISISKSKVIVVHQEKNKEQKIWEGNPYWTRVKLDINNAKLKNYLTLNFQKFHRFLMTPKKGKCLYWLMIKIEKMKVI